MSSPAPSEPDGFTLVDCRHWLLAKYARSEPGAAEAFVRAYDLVAYQTAWRVLRVREDAEEVAQDSLFRLLKLARIAGVRPQIDSAAAESGYVCRTATNEALNRLKKKQQLPAATGIDLAAKPDPRAAIARDGPRLARLWICLGRLDELSFGIIERRFFAGLSVLETAELLGIPPGTVKSRTAAALSRLAECCRSSEEKPK